MIKNSLIVILFSLSHLLTGQKSDLFIIIDNETNVVIENNDFTSSIICDGCKVITFNFKEQYFTGVVNGEVIEFTESDKENGQFVYRIDRVEYLNSFGQTVYFKKINDHMINISGNELSIDLQKTGNVYSVTNPKNNAHLPLIQLAVLLGFNWL
ncbi:MAG TPA: hypothetical protein EYQ86_07200 [Bacteroidetes bacterium]|nr:hypothetical protein [Bacteroidota bacterium]